MTGNNTKQDKSSDTNTQSATDGESKQSGLSESQSGKDDANSMSGTLNSEDSSNDDGVNNADNANSADGRERNSNKKVVVAGEQVENAARSNPIGFDVKPYLAFAILLVLAITTLFAAGHTAHKPKGSIGGKHYKRPGMS